MKRKLNFLFLVIAWFAVIAQFAIMMQNRIEPVGETIIRFFSYFTILSNSMVAVYFSREFLRKSPDSSGTLTAVTVYIFIVGLVYQIVLRPIWEPQGLQMLVDELLHSVVPLCVLIYWILYERKEKLNWKQIPKWLIYPLVYLIFILIRGNFSHFYPYPFVNVDALGMPTVLLNSLILMCVFIFVSAILVGVGKGMTKNKFNKK